MNATATQGVWTEELSPEVSIQFDTNRNRVTVQKKGENPIHIDYPNEITVKETDKIIAKTKKAYNIQ